jgi:hypothetical protein
MLSNIPPDINAEVLLDYLLSLWQGQGGGCTVAFKGPHKRNAYRDIAEMEQNFNGKPHLVVGRNSLYNYLPEYMFHPIDRFDNLPRYEEKEKFEEQLQQEKEEIEDAFRFFSPIDTLLLIQRMRLRRKVEPFARENTVMQGIICDSLTDAQRQNRFIRQTIPFTPLCKRIRGNKTLLTLMLRKILMDEGLKMVPTLKPTAQHDEHPRYDCTLGQELGEGYVGNDYDESVACYDIHYWREEECNEHFLRFLDEMEEYRRFIQDFFLSVEQLLTFNIVHDEEPLKLACDDEFYYLNYNTNV